MIVRPAVETDLQGILMIENREIEEGFAHFGTEPVTLDQATCAFHAARGKHPWFVADEDGIVGFARCSTWKARESYQWTVEVGVYVLPEFQGKGIGRALYEHLFPSMRDCGVRTVLAGIALPNPSSVKLHEAFGMEHVGTLPKVGFKKDRWIDVGYWARHFEC